MKKNLSGNSNSNDKSISSKFVKKILKKSTVTAMVLTCAVTLTACGRDKGNENQDPLTGQEMTQTQESTAENTTENMTNTEGIGDEFDRLLNDTSADVTGIIDYINTNIVGAGVADVERFFTGLFGYGDDIRNIDFTRLDVSRENMPEDVTAFMDLMKLEADTPSVVMSDEENRKTINMTLSEMLERALLFEQHIEKYPDNVSTEPATKLYEEIATAAITGGYDKEQGIEHYYKGEAENSIDKDSLQYYQQFAEANPDSNLGKIVKDYVAILESNEFQINETVEEFYMSLRERLNPNTWLANAEATTETSTEITTDEVMENNDISSTDAVIEGSIVE